MPTYSYRCGNCKKEFEKFHNINEKVESCIFCGCEVKKIFTKAPGIHFKGPGFYSNDH
ncbi:MAG: FmdB family zinc ribbon protein [Halanaerobiales bacterium]